MDVAYRSYQTISQASFKAPLERNVLAARGAEAEGAADIELRWIAVPPSFAQDPELAPFDPWTTNALADVGRAVAERPDGGWRTDLPQEGET